MKFTEKYIKMCDTPEIQDNWKPEVGDWYVYDDNLTDSLIIHGIDPINKQTQCQKIWLPLQHQLQEMAWDKDVRIDLAIYDLQAFMSIEEGSEYCMTRGTMNEFLLSYTMHELHQKKWNNTKGVWV